MGHFVCYSNILGHMEEEAIYREGSDSDHKSRLPESEENHGNISIKVEENTMESDVARCSHTEQLQSPMFQVSFGGDQVMIKCEEEERLEHSFDAGNHSQLFHPWADEDQHSSHFNNILKGIKEEPRDENEPVVEVEGSPAGNQENGESYAVVKVNVEEDKQVSNAKLHLGLHFWSITLGDLITFVRCRITRLIRRTAFQARCLGMVLGTLLLVDTDTSGTESYEILLK